MRYFSALAAVAISTTAVSAQAATVNFDQGTDTASYASQGLVLNGFTILSNTFGGAVSVPSSPNYANVDATGSTISFVNAAGVASLSNGFGLTIPGLNAGGGFYAGGTLTFLDVAGNVLGTQSFAPIGPNSSRSPIVYSNTFQGIRSVVFSRDENVNGPALFPIDDVTFTVAGAVPEPATWGMMILGFGAIGGVLRRKARSTTVRYAI